MCGERVVIGFLRDGRGRRGVFPNMTMRRTCGVGVLIFVMAKYVDDVDGIASKIMPRSYSFR